MQAPPSLSKDAQFRYQFADVEFDEASFQLYVAGKPVLVQRKPLEVLALLLQRGGEVLTKDELLDTVWAGTLPVENVVANAINKLRAALGKNGGAHIVTQPRIGYRLEGPVQRFESQQAFEAAATLGAGQDVPHRPDFVLQTALGSAPEATVWLAQHRHTGAQHVFKFAQTSAELNALKREAALQRYLLLALGPRDDLICLLNSNFDRLPFYLESTYGGPNLLEWASGDGSPLQSLTLPQRLLFFSRICETVSAAHSVGVLHKDLKPGNILIRYAQGTGECLPTLVDFGNASLLDTNRARVLSKEQLSQTLTDTAHANAVAGTLMYAAPETFTQATSTIQSDVYSLGILLYQLLVGDLSRPMLPGWERDIPDDLLCADIALATDGKLEHRLSSVSLLRDRVITLEERRKTREQHQIQAALIASQVAADNRRKAVRPWVLALGAALIIGSLTSFLFFLDARSEAKQAERESKQAEAINRFLKEDVLAASSPAAPGLVSNPRMSDVLQAAAERIETRFSDDADTKAELYLTLARTHRSMSDYRSAQLDLAKILATESGVSPSADKILAARYEMASILVLEGQRQNALAMLKLADIRMGAGIQEHNVLAMYAAKAHGEFSAMTGEPAQAEDYLLHADALRAELLPADTNLMIEIRTSLAEAMMTRHKYAEVEQLLHPLMTEDDSMASLGARAWGNLHASYSEALAGLGRLDEAITLQKEAVRALTERLGAQHYDTGLALHGLANLMMTQGKPIEAAKLERQVYAIMQNNLGKDSRQTLITLSNLGAIELESGESHLALQDLSNAHAEMIRTMGADFPMVMATRFFLCHAQLQEGQVETAWAGANALDPKAIETAGIADGGNWAARIQDLKTQIQMAKARHLSPSGLKGALASAGKP